MLAGFFYVLFYVLIRLSAREGEVAYVRLDGSRSMSGVNVGSRRDRRFLPSCQRMADELSCNW